jgi:hypothetical protein
MLSNATSIPRVTDGGRKRSRTLPREGSEADRDVEYCSRSVTFGDCAENGVGMQMIGTAAPHGFTVDELQSLQVPRKVVYDLTELLPPEMATVDMKQRLAASIVVIPGGVRSVLGDDPAAPAAIKRELEEQIIDRKAKMRGRVVNKRMRWNNTFGERRQDANFEEGKGTVIAFIDVPWINRLRQALPVLLGPKAKDLVAETNDYYDLKKCGIGFHGDSERKIVVCARLGQSMPLHFQWYQRSQPIGKLLSIMLNDGDMYIMSEKATGQDWKRKIIPTLRHAAGALNLIVKNAKKDAKEKSAK